MNFFFPFWFLCRPQRTRPVSEIKTARAAAAPGQLYRLAVDVPPSRPGGCALGPEQNDAEQPRRRLFALPRHGADALQGVYDRDRNPLRQAGRPCSPPRAEAAERP